MAFIDIDMNIEIRLLGRSEPKAKPALLKGSKASRGIEKTSLCGFPNGHTIELVMEKSFVRRKFSVVSSFSSSFANRKWQSSER